MIDLTETIAELRRALARYEFTDPLGHPLENCVEYRALCDAAKRVAKLDAELQRPCAHCGETFRTTAQATAIETTEQRLAELEQAQRWIPVGERLPERPTVPGQQRRMLVSASGRVSPAYYTSTGAWMLDGWSIHNVDAWRLWPRPFPARPRARRRMMIELHGEALIEAETNALRQVWPEARIRPSLAGHTWQVWPDYVDQNNWGRTQLSVPLGEPTGHLERVRARASLCNGTGRRWMLDEMAEAGIPFEEPAR